MEINKHTDATGATCPRLLTLASPTRYLWLGTLKSSPVSISYAPGIAVGGLISVIVGND